MYFPLIWEGCFVSSVFPGGIDVVTYCLLQHIALPGTYRFCRVMVMFFFIEIWQNLNIREFILLRSGPLHRSQSHVTHILGGGDHWSASSVSCWTEILPLLITMKVKSNINFSAIVLIRNMQSNKEEDDFHAGWSLPSTRSKHVYH